MKLLILLSLFGTLSATHYSCYVRLAPGKRAQHHNWYHIQGIKGASVQDAYQQCMAHVQRYNWDLVHDGAFNVRVVTPENGIEEFTV